MRNSRFTTGGFAGGAALSLLCVGCQASTVESTPPSDPVSVDFYAQGQRGPTCSGTLLSPNVVLTTAECADHTDAARVKVGTTQSAEVDEVFYYDWTAAPSQVPRHDVALLVLRAPIPAQAYAPVAADDPVVALWMHGIIAAASQSTAADGPLHFSGDPARLVDTSPNGDLVTSVPLSYRQGPKLVLGDPKYWHPESGQNYWIARDNDPNADAWGQASGVAAADPNAAYIFAHGTPGWIEGLPPKDAVKTLYQNNGQQLVLASCFGGTQSGPANNAGKLADTLLLPRDTIYGCDGYIGAWRQKMYCNGQWVDGNGTPLTDEKRQKLVLQNCAFTVDPEKGETTQTNAEVDASCH